jgi:hypothetical protein
MSVSNESGRDRAEVGKLKGPRTRNRNDTTAFILGRDCQGGLSCRWQKESWLRIFVRRDEAGNFSLLLPFLSKLRHASNLGSRVHNCA